MTINIAENIKRLRKSRDITQEQFAELIGVSNVAVSKWERGETYPDIALLPVIASFFCVSLDELMGYSKNVSDADIEKIISEYWQMRANGQFEKATEHIIKAREQYPADYSIMSVYMHNLIGGKIADKELLVKNKHELLRLCDLILSGCNTEKIRLEAINVKAQLLHVSGQTEKALELLSQFPTFGETSGIKSEQLFEYDTEESKAWVLKNLYGLSEGFAIKLVKRYWFGNIDAENNERVIENIADRILEIYNTTDDTVFLVMAHGIYAALALRMTANWGDVNSIIRIRRKQLECATQIDRLCETDGVLKECIASTYNDKKLVPWIIEHLRETPQKTFEKMRQNLEFVEMVEKYSTYQ